MHACIHACNQQALLLGAAVAIVAARVTTLAASTVAVTVAVVAGNHGYGATAHTHTLIDVAYVCVEVAP